METDVVEEFYGVYLLKCLNPDYKGRTYIGYTVDPNRRIKQHNKGKLFGGAYKTSKKGPWEMTLIVHGFPSDVAALRFEWAWQHPKCSRRIKSIVPTKRASETSFDYCLKIMYIMLRTPPWCRLPLTVRWLSADLMVDPPANLSPPVHMPIIFGPVVPKKLKLPRTLDVLDDLCICKLCINFIKENELLVCLNDSCKVQWHIMCLAKKFLSAENFGNDCSENILPVEGCCTECGSNMLWGDLIRKKKGCYSNSLVKADEGLFNYSE